jgi:hypothetical protein
MAIENVAPTAKEGEQPLYVFSLPNELRKLSQHAEDAWR